ncbi:hypothetical protein CONLIGDRAFT_290233 [Coniochaeta ligniaria NRRL 30616]|uniref:Uncharacterized protein n=1 Tax=Coniochaeta ligniaria NRRL 30616 TaxID=1408157 RepID=A0A1J7ISZ3_9PEZI|nr:hypothetical protein CONLIGDRAFT_290233 [Coniochaeta ligniaria NRRL 30616]
MPIREPEGCLMHKPASSRLDPPCRICSSPPCIWRSRVGGDSRIPAVWRLALVVCVGTTCGTLIWAEAELPASISHVRRYIRHLALQWMAFRTGREGDFCPFD